MAFIVDKSPRSVFYGLDSVREQALELKTADDIDQLYCHIINRFEAATCEGDPARRRRLLTFVVVRGGCTGVETVAEVQEFMMHLRAVRRPRPGRDTYGAGRNTRLRPPAG